MNIDSLSRLIESADVSVFRTISALFMPMINLPDADFCDGPYDGGKDFTVIENKIKGIKIGVQLSIESDWRKKIRSDANKTKKSFGTNLLYFLSSRRIPEGSFESFREEILKETGVHVTKYDNQAIASRFIKNNKVSDLLSAYGICHADLPNSINKYMGAKNEAIYALLLFGQDSKDFKSGLLSSIIKSVISRTDGYGSRAELIDDVKLEFGLSDGQGVLVNSQIDSLMQRGEIILECGKFLLSEKEFKYYNGLRESSKFEANLLRDEISAFLIKKAIDLNEKHKDFLLENHLELTLALIEKSLNISGATEKENEFYTSMRDLLAASLGEDRAFEILIELTDLISKNEFTKRVASAKLYEILLNSDASRLINALGGSESLNIYLDSSVAIPIICGLLFEVTMDRYSKSANTLYRLIKEHQFRAIIPEDYLEEISVHLIEACRNYRYIIESGEDLSFSDNAFVSHYCAFVKKSVGQKISFHDYVNIFGIKLNSISQDMPDTEFYYLRDAIKKIITEVFTKYGIIAEKMISHNVENIISIIQTVLADHHLTKPDVLIRHDARVISHLGGSNTPLGYVNILCTWDKIHIQLNQDGSLGYFVLNPLALIDLLSISNSKTDGYPVSHLTDFVFIQSTRDIDLSSRIWDAIAKIDKSKTADATFLLAAKKFKEKFFQDHANDKEILPLEIERSWNAWKKTIQSPT